MSHSESLLILIVNTAKSDETELYDKLEQLGHTTEIANSVDEAKKLTENKKHKLQILINPNLDEIKALLKFNIYEYSESLPMLIIADSGSEKLIVRALRLGVDDFLMRDNKISYLDLLDALMHKAIRSKKNKTTRFFAEQAFKESEAKFRSLVQNLQDGICTFDGNEVFSFANPAAEKIFGVEKGQLLNRSLLEFVDSDTAAMIQEQTKLRYKGFVGRYDILINRQNGDKRKVSLTVSPQFDYKGNLVKILGIFKDVTDEKELFERLTFQSTILDQIQDRILATDLEGKITYVNHMVLKSLGKESDELIGETTQTLGEDSQKGATQQEIVEKTLKNGNWRGEVVNFTNDNKEIIFDCRTKLFYDEKDKPIGMIGISTDVTESKNIELALKTSEEKYKFLAENQKDVVFTMTIDGYLEYVSPVVRSFGYDPKEEEGKHFSIYMPYPEEVELAYKMLKKITQDLKPNSIELTYTAKDGTNVSVEISITPIVENGKCKLVNCIMRDISERKKVEEALRESEERLTKAQEVAEIGSWEYDIKTRQPKWSAQLFKIFGIEPGQEEPDFDEHKEFIHPDDWEYFKQSGVKAIKNKTGFDIEIRIVQPSGKIVWVNSKCEAKIENGAVVGFIGTTQNINYRKKVDNDLKQALIESRSLYDAARAVFEGKTFAECARQVFDACRSATGAVSGYIALLSEDGTGNEVLFLEDGGMPCTVDPSLPMPIRGLREVVYRENRVVYENDFMNSDWIKFMPAGHVVLNNILFAPLTIDDVVVGVLGVANKPTDFNENDSRLAQAFGEIAAVSLERSRYIEKLRNREERYKAFINATEDMVYVKDLNFRYIMINKANADFFGMDEEEIIGKTDFELMPEANAELCRKSDVAAIQENCVIVTQEEVNNKIYEARKFPLVLDSQKGVGAFIRDVTARKKQEDEIANLEEQFRQAQKMEAIGLLAGGVAHDFNNILNVIMGYSELLMQRLSKNDDVYEKIESIRKNADRATILTRQLLAFSRKQILQPTILNLNKVIHDMGNMLQRLIGEDIELTTVLDPTLSSIKADKGQIEQVMMNIIINARDAMPDGGKLTIETQNIKLDNEYIKKHTDGSVGYHVKLTINDTGVGMTKEVQEKCFEPFFTTKKSGKGTGLGISTAYGIVKQSGGSIWVDSELGVGTTFSIYFPIASEKYVSNRLKASEATIRKRNLTVLVVEDNTPMCEMIAEILTNADFRVFKTSSPSEVFELYKQHRQEIDILLTDVVMPGMSGKKLVEQLQQINENLKVLFMSGYTDDAIVHQGVLDEGTEFIQKPFKGKDLIKKLHAIYNDEELD